MLDLCFSLLMHFNLPHIFCGTSQLTLCSCPYIPVLCTSRSIACIALLVDSIHSLLNLYFESETFWIKWLDERKWIACNYLAVTVLQNTIWNTACSLPVLLSISANKNATLVYLCVTIWTCMHYFNNAYPCTTISTSAVYLGGSKFKSWSGDWLS